MKVIHFYFVKHFNLHLVGIFCMVFLQSGCTLAPEYKQPPSPISMQWPELPKITLDVESGTAQLSIQNVQQFASTRQTIGDLGWEDFFRDPRLRALISLGLDNNRDLRIAVSRIEQARAQYGVQVGQQFPSIALSISDTTTRLPTAMLTPGVDALSSNFLGGASLVSFQLDLFGQLRSLSEAAFQSYLATAEAGRNVRITLISDIAQAYFYERMTDLTLELVDKTLKSRQEAYAIVLKRMNAGIATDLDLNQARSLLNAAAANLAQYARQKSRAHNALVLLVGRPLTMELPQAAPFNRASVLIDIPVGLPSDLLTRRPDIRQAERKLMAANANIGAARAAFFPDISLTGLLGTNSLSLSGLFKSGAYYWSIAPNLSLPIFSGGALWANLDLAKAANREAVNQYEKSIQTAFKESSDALAGEATYGAEIQAATAEQESTRKALELSNMRYTMGIDNFLQAQIAQINYFNAQLSLIKLRYDALLNRIDLYKALGGGWESGDMEKKTPLLEPDAQN
jgi:multidrug efflux system outer membrane protein